jgi:hypothetical protein
LITAALLLVFAMVQVRPVQLDAQTPPPTPAAPGSGGVTFGSVRVLSGNNLERNTGQENQPPVWLTIDSKGTSAVVTIGNATKVPLDFTGTVVLTLAPGVSANQVLVSTGSTVIEGNQIVWSGFSLSSGQIVPSIVQLATNGSGSSAPAGTASIAGVSIDAKDTQSGTSVTEQAAGGGPAVSALGPAPSATTATRAAAAVPPGREAVTPLSYSAARTFGAWALALLIATLVALTIVAWLILRTGRRIERQVAAVSAAAVSPDGSAETSRQSSIDGGPATNSSGAPAEDGQAARLAVQDGSQPGRSWPLEAEEITIGRNQRNDIVLIDPRVSDRHARLLRQTGGAYLLIDAASTNGTLVNGERISEPVRLRDGDLVHVGTSTLVFHEAAPVVLP